jgi:hypothetical protein
VRCLRGTDEALLPAGRSPSLSPMAYKPQPIKVATNLPPPPTLTAQDFQQIDAEATALRAAFNRDTASLERLTAEDLRIRLR